jgi:hypothetical protein
MIDEGSSTLTVVASPANLTSDSSDVLKVLHLTFKEKRLQRSRREALPEVLILRALPAKA